jgi:hypothetical protein
VSRFIYSPSDSQEAQICYGQLTNKGLEVRITTAAFSFSHQKYWLIDFNNNTVLPSTIMYMSTGNWGATDYPDGNTFPPYSQPNWAPENRDYTFVTTDQAVMTIFYNVLQGDLGVSSPWKPS